MESGLFVVNVVKDLGLEVGKLVVCGVWFVFEGSKLYFWFYCKMGDLFVKEKLDRELFCGKVDLCVLYFEIVLVEFL